MSVPSVILLAEDSDDDAFFVARALQTAGLPHTLFRVKNGAECISYLKGEAPYDDRAKYPLPNLILLDLKMPMLTGFDVLAWLKQQPSLQFITAVVLSGSIVPEDRTTTINLGAKAYYMKPMETGTLTEVMKAVDSNWLSALP